MKLHRPTTPDPDGDQPPTGQSPLLARLVAQVDRLAHDLDAALPALTGLRTDVDTHTRTLADLTDLLRRLTPTAEAAGSGAGALGRPVEPPAAQPAPEPVEPAALEWLTIADPAAAVGVLSALWVWTRDVFVPYLPAGGAGLPDCWPWHPTVVAELLACHAAWISALHPNAPLEALAGWHDRWRPSTWTRVKPTVTRCTRDDDGLHIDGNSRYRHDPAWLDEYATWWTTTHQHRAGPDTPGLTSTHPDPLTTRAAVAAVANGAHR